MRRKEERGEDSGPAVSRLKTGLTLFQTTNHRVDDNLSAEHIVVTNGKCKSMSWFDAFSSHKKAARFKPLAASSSLRLSPLLPFAAATSSRPSNPSHSFQSHTPIPSTRTQLAERSEATTTQRHTSQKHCKQTPTRSIVGPHITSSRRLASPPSSSSRRHEQPQQTTRS